MRSLSRTISETTLSAQSLASIAAIFCALMFSTLQPAIAGGSVSGGGEFVTTEHNPWFVGDEPVTYCIDHNAIGFSLARNRIQALVGKALQDWRESFKHLSSTPMTPAHRLAGQFVEENCLSSTQLKFNMGGYFQSLPGLLSPFTLAYAYRNPQEIGSSRYAGVIAFAPDQGPYAYQPPTGLIERRFWSDENRFYSVLLHEIGHAYGVPHIPGTLMAEEFPAQTALTSSARLGGELSSMDFVRDNFGAEGGPNKVCGTIENNSSNGLNVDDFKRACVSSKQMINLGSRKSQTAVFELSFEAANTSGNRNYILSGSLMSDTSKRRTIQILGNYPVQPTGSNWPEVLSRSAENARNFMGPANFLARQVFAQIQDSFEIHGIAKSTGPDGEKVPVILRYGFPRRGLMTVNFVRRSGFKELSFMDELRTLKLKNETDRN